MGVPMKLSDYVVSFLEKIGVEHVFMISGGGIMHIVDSVGKSRELKYVCSQHEQAASMAAEAYARLKGLGVCIVTTGPGVTNALTGTIGAMLDSIPVLYISGQVNTNHMVQSTGLPLRQLGDQEINTIDLVRSITKYSVTITNPQEIRYHLEKAVFLAKSGRPGPVWIDIPLNIQSASVNPADLRRFNKNEITHPFETNKKNLEKLVSEIMARIQKSKRPVILAGNGIRSAGAEKEFLQLAKLLKVPILSSFAGYDLIDSSHPYYMGRPGIIGQRAANFIIQNADILLSIGCRLNTRIVSYNNRSFAREAFKIAIDIDKAELQKPTIKLDMAVNYDAKDFIEEFNRQLNGSGFRHDNEWVRWCRLLNSKYPVTLPEYWQEKKYVNSYCFIDTLSENLTPYDVLVLADGTACVCTYQAFKVKQGQRVILNSGCAAMGYGFPAAIGASFARKGQRIICLEGDGSLQMNIQELQTMKYHSLPIKLFIYENDGYHSIRTTQETYFDSRYVATDKSSGVSSPNFLKLAEAYGFPAFEIKNIQELYKVPLVLNSKGPAVCVIRMNPRQPLIPKVLGEKLPDGRIRSKPLEDMYPFLPRSEFKENMLIKPWEEE